MNNRNATAARGAFAAVAITFSALTASAADVKTVAVKSDSMKKEVKVVVITPSAYADKKTKFPVVYFLHGFSGDQTVWGTQSGLAPLADRYGMIFVSPDGAKSSWWIDSPVDDKMKYETFVSRELVKFIDANYRTIADRRHRAITGESMGGHGALFNAIRHKDVFGAVASIYGGTDLPPFAGQWDLNLRLGDIKEHPDNWQKFSAVDAAKTLRNGELAIFSIIGTSDFFLKVNREFHDLLSKNKVEHYYLEVRGRDEPHSFHTFQRRVNTALPLVLNFFRNYFRDGTASLR